LTYNAYLGKYYILHIEFMGYDVKISFANAITGPWSPWQLIFNIPPPWNNATLGVFDYAPKVHPELAANDREIIVSFASNTVGIEPLFNNPDIYTPQFFRVILN